MGLLRASGPQEFSAIKRECNTQATDYTPENVVKALHDLLNDCEIACGDDEESDVYGLPDEM
jgi:hypothetical protein